jgi:rhodanese-related sulfurtransferase
MVVIADMISDIAGTINIFPVKMRCQGGTVFTDFFGDCAATRRVAAWTRRQKSIVMKRLSVQVALLIAAALVLLMPFYPQYAVAQYRSPESVDGAITASAEEAKAPFDQGVVFIDVRNPRLYAKGHIVGAQHLDLKNGFAENAVAALVGRDQPLVIYCSGVNCSRSYRASAQAVSWGFAQVHYFRGGIADWRDAGYPTEASGTD